MEEQERTEQRQEDPGTQQILEFGSSLIHSKRGGPCAYHRGADRRTSGPAPQQQEHQI